MTTTTAPNKCRKRKKGDQADFKSLMKSSHSSDEDLSNDDIGTNVVLLIFGICIQNRVLASNSRLDIVGNKFTPRKRYVLFTYYVFFWAQV